MASIPTNTPTSRLLKVRTFAPENFLRFLIMKKIVSLVCSIAFSTSMMAGGLMTNTNYHIAFDRMFARGATTEIDGVFSNPAGIAFGHEGWQLSLNFQKPWQNRDITLSDSPLGSTVEGKYEGKAYAPIVPAIFATYKHNRWSLGAMFGIVGSGGFVKYDKGVPMFNVMLTDMLQRNGIAPGTYRIDAQMKGKQYIYGGQVNFAYRITNNFSAAAGLRVNYYDGYYRGHVHALEHPKYGKLASLDLDVDQRGWGFTPVISLNYKIQKFTFAAKYEFRTKVETKNRTNLLNAGLGSLVAADMAAVPGGAAKLAALSQTLDEKTADYKDGVKTRYDMPALLSVAVGYEFMPNLRAAVEYHFYDDKNAKMAHDRQKELTHGTHEILAGVEWDINKKFTVSCGGQRTDYGLSDGYQQNTSFACDSWSIGLGGAWNINEKVRLNASYFCSLYSDYKKNTAYGLETYSRTNHVIGVGIDYKF